MTATRRAFSTKRANPLQWGIKIAVCTSASDSRKETFMRLNEVSLRPSPETRDIMISDQSESLLALKLLNRLQDYEASLSDKSAVFCRDWSPSCSLNTVDDLKTQK